MIKRKCDVKDKFGSAYSFIGNTTVHTIATDKTTAHMLLAQY